MSVKLLQTSNEGGVMDEAFIPCDACGQRSYVHVILDVDDLPLSFCSHHWTANADALMAYTIHTVDLRHMLTEGAAVSKQTLEALDAAIRAHAKDVDDDGSMVIDWVFGYATMDHEEVFGINYATPPASTPHASVGLMQMASQLINDDVSGCGAFVDDDDERD